MNSTNPATDLIQQFHIERSKLLDAFVLIEAAVTKLLTNSKTAFNGEMLGQRIELLRNAKVGPQFSKKSRVEVLLLLDKIAPLLPIRNDLAHSKLSMAFVDHEHLACFINARQAPDPCQCARLFRLEQLKKLTLKIRKIAGELDQPQPVNPPSSPPPPSQDATGGP